MSPVYFSCLSGCSAITYPGHERDINTDHLLSFVEHEFKEFGVVPPHDSQPLAHIWFANQKMAKAVRSGTLATWAMRNTKFFSVGPAFHLAPSQWRLREIWISGGLVTFSPTFILRSPEKFAEIMGMIKDAPTSWGAYIVPQVVQWIAASWQNPA